MSFFFGVWTSQGFILASDVRLILNGEAMYIHKLAIPSRASKVNCAIAVCGEYPSNSLSYFSEATLTKDSLREVAEQFASRWVKRYAGTTEYSAVHLVGYERIDACDILLPQMWFWSNWAGKGYYGKKTLEEQLSSFAEPIPHNNHIPHKIKQLTSRFPGPTPEEECKLVMAFLKQSGPYYTWNGDNDFWRSAADAVGSALDLLLPKKSDWTLGEVRDVTCACLEFLIKVGNILPDSTVGLSDEGGFDVVQVTPEGATWINRARIDEHDEHTTCVIRQGRALVRAIESLAAIEPTGPIERFLVGLLLPAYKRRLRGIVEGAPGWMSEEIVGTSGRIGYEDKQALVKELEKNNRI